MAISALKILLQMTWPDSQVTRLWDGSGPYVDGDGHLWKGAALITGLDAIEQAINGEAASLDIALSGISLETADMAWSEYQAGNVIDATLQILLQPLDADDQPSGAAAEMFAGRVDNIVFDDTVSGETGLSNVTVSVTNRFSYRRLANGASLSDADQRARSAVLNPGGNPDLFAERVPLMQNKTVVWPRFS